MSRISDVMRQRSIEMAATAPTRNGPVMAVAYNVQRDAEGNTDMWAVYWRTETTFTVWYLGYVTEQGEHVRLRTIDTGTCERPATDFGLVVDVPWTRPPADQRQPGETEDQWHARMREEREQALLGALDGIELDEQDRQTVRWLSYGGPTAAGVIVSWLSRARAAGQQSAGGER
jgi:hypothetical protein